MTAPRTDTSGLEERLGHGFSDEALLRLALTHSSWINESAHGGESNERLEFLGDAVLELCVSEELYARFPGEREGRLTRLRARLVREPALARLAREIALPDYIYLGRGEESQGGRDRDSLLADAFEAIMGAVFVDGGFEASRKVVSRLLAGLWPESAELPHAKDHKTALQEVTQTLFRARPVYSLVGAEGPDHAKIYRVRVDLPDGRSFEAQASSKKTAEQESARLALTELSHDAE
ncbi:ribonuclease III [Desulfohalovibrio reitneri]|uniref:ribonuclease III n=1 Tax=Desulfohalovibrio reitneri TaxID=1307759 RepID=UPI0004A71214|nr:ribonuclease III [Desulfohalovibrio reitneri]